MDSSPLRALAAVLLAAQAVTATAQTRGHVHGVARLDAALEGPTLSVELVSPLESLLGFERAPRTDAERASAKRLVERLRDAGGMFVINAEARCKPFSAELDTGALEGKASAGHADVSVRHVFRCEHPASLRSLQVNLFDGYTRLQRIEARLASPTGQRRATLVPGKRVFAW